MSEWERGLRERQGKGRFVRKEELDVSTYGDEVEASTVECGDCLGWRFIGVPLEGGSLPKTCPRCKGTGRVAKCCEPDCPNVAEASGRCTRHTELEEVLAGE